MTQNSPAEQDVLEKTLLKLISVLSRNKGKLLLSLVLGGMLGIALSFTVKKKFTSKSLILPELGASKMGSLGSLASMAGLDAGSGDGDALRPDLFPNILQSNTAALHLLALPVQSDSGKAYPSLLSYYEATEKQKVDHGFLETQLADTLYKFSVKEASAIAFVKNAIKADYDKKNGIVTVQIELTDARVAAMTLRSALGYLKDYALEYRYGKKKQQSKFVSEQLKSAKARMEKTRYSLQAYRDQNRNIFSNTVKITEQKLQEDYATAFSIYNELLGESERLNISTQEEKPLFQILDYPSIPSGKSSPNRLFFGVGGGILSLILTLVGILIPWGRLFSRRA